LLRRPFVTVPPRSAAGVWLTVDATDVPPGKYTAPITFSGDGLPDRTVTLQVRIAPPVSPQQPTLVGGYTSPPEGEIYTRDFSDHHMRVWYGSQMSKAEMQRRGIQLCVLQISSLDEATIRGHIENFKSLGLDYEDWVFSIKDEPHGRTEEELKPYLDIAKAVRKVDPRARMSFNPGEAAPLVTFQILAPYCDVWLPYTHHRVYTPQEAAAKRAIFTVKPWMWYTTPDLWDKSPDWPTQIYSQIREVPGQPGNILGTLFFAYYYPFRDAWDAGHEFLSDAGVAVLPSRHGPVATRAWEAIREGIQDADLAQVVKESLGPPITDESINKMLMESSIEELVDKAFPQATGKAP
jgi:hypothetical protein